MQRKIFIEITYKYLYIYMYILYIYIYIYMSCQELANKTCRTESKNWEGFSGTASKNWKVFRKCVCVCQDLCLHMSRTFCMWVLCETHVRHMMHVKWWSGTHLNIVTTAKKVQTNLFETSSIVPHGCSCMKVFLGDDSIFEDTLYDYLMLSGQKIVKNVCNLVEK